MGSIHNTSARLENVKKRIEESSKISDSNKKHIFDFKKECISQGLSRERVIFYLERLYKVAKWVDKDFEYMGKQDIKDLIVKIQQMDNYSERTKYDYKVAIKKLFQILEGYEWKSKKYPEKVDWIKLTLRNNSKKLPEEILTQKEVKRMVRSADRLRNKALIWTLYESGCRIGEFLPIKRKQLEFDKYGAVLRVNGKTGSRRIRLVSSVPLLKDWLKAHSKDEKEAFVWQGNNGGRICYNRARHILQEVAKKAGVEKKVNPHMFRHSRATHLATKLTEAEMKEYFGWTQSSDMASIYVHLSGRDVDNSILKIHGIKNDEKGREEKVSPQKCPRCEKVNSPERNRCGRCDLPLNPRAIMDYETEKRFDLDEKIEQLLERKIEEKMKEIQDKS